MKCRNSYSIELDGRTEFFLAWGVREGGQEEGEERRQRMRSGGREKGRNRLAERGGETKE